MMTLGIYKKQVEQELQNILAVWMQHATDEKHGGFHGKIDNDNIIYAGAPKGAVLNSRILWTFSAAHNYAHNNAYRAAADRAYQYMLTHFLDKEFGGIYWSVDYKGQPLDTKKQVYAIAFALYAVSEYYKCNHLEPVKELAILLFQQIEQHSYDNMHTGYFEAFTRDWQPIDDLRLSAKDANEKKTMNTHLHILEAYSNLYRIWPDSVLKAQIIKLIYNFTEHIIDPDSHHLILFFDEYWNPKPGIISFGHDIEAAWLLMEAAEVIQDQEIIAIVQTACLQIASAAEKGLDADGGLWYEREEYKQHLIKEKHWWPQAEAMVGFFSAWQLSGEKKFLTHSFNSWQFIQLHLLDKKNGEWFWGVQEDYSIMPGEDKAGFWKCPYHNGRACLEIIRRTGG